MISLNDGKLWAEASHVAFAREPLVVVDGKDISRWGWKFHGQMRCGYDCTKSVEGWSVEEDIIGCGRVNDEETERNCLGLSVIAENAMEIDVARVETFSPEKPYMGSSYGTMAVVGSWSF